jgi:hypothetical protein
VGGSIVSQGMNVPQQPGAAPVFGVAGGGPRPSRPMIQPPFVPGMSGPQPFPTQGSVAQADPSSPLAMMGRPPNPFPPPFGQPQGSPQLTTIGRPPNPFPPPFGQPQGSPPMSSPMFQGLGALMAMRGASGDARQPMGGFGSYGGGFNTPMSRFGAYGGRGKGGGGGTQLQMLRGLGGFFR